MDIRAYEPKRQMPRPRPGEYNLLICFLRGYMSIIMLRAVYQMTSLLPSPLYQRSRRDLNKLRRGDRDHAGL